MSVWYSGFKIETYRAVKWFWSVSPTSAMASKPYSLFTTGLYTRAYLCIHYMQQKQIKIYTHLAHHQLHIIIIKPPNNNTKHTASNKREWPLITTKFISHILVQSIALKWMIQSILNFVKLCVCVYISNIVVTTISPTMYYIWVHLWKLQNRFICRLEVARIVLFCSVLYAGYCSVPGCAALYLF